jgi:photosystem II stability/assembly factor-like uncharacterized protein
MHRPLLVRGLSGLFAQSVKNPSFVRSVPIREGFLLLFTVASAVPDDAPTPIGETSLPAQAIYPEVTQASSPIWAFCVGRTARFWRD